MDLEASIHQLSQQLADQIAARTRALLEEAQARIQSLEQALEQQTQLRLQAEDALRQEQLRSAALLHERNEEQQQRQASQQELQIATHELQTLRTAILEQLEQAEAERERELQAEIERRRRWQEGMQNRQHQWLRQMELQSEALAQQILSFRDATDRLLWLDGDGGQGAWPSAAAVTPAMDPEARLVCSH